MTQTMIAYAALVLIAAGLALSAVWLLAGLAWALLTAGGCVFAASEILRRGMTSAG